MHSSSILRSTAPWYAALLFAAACGGVAVVDADGGGGAGAGGAGAGGAGGNAATTSNATSNATVGTTTTTSASSGGSTCLDPDNVCDACASSQCAATAQACCAAFGCVEVVRCAIEKGCFGVECYSPEFCMMEIDIAGLDVAQNQAQAFGDCLISQCPGECAANDN